MSIELAPRNIPKDVDREIPPTVLDRLMPQGTMVKQEEIEVVTTASGTTLYIPQSLDE